MPIPGTKRLAYLEENAESVNLELDKSDLDELSSIFETVSGPRYSESNMALDRALDFGADF